MSNEIFLGVMDLNEAKTHQIKLKSQGISIHFKTNESTCTTGCKVTVEVWAHESDLPQLQNYFQDDYLKHVKGHVPNFEYMSQVFNPGDKETICQACGEKFSPTLTECPECGLVYS